MIGPDAIFPILMDTLVAAMDRDVDRIAEVTRSVFLDGDEADLYSFLRGLLEATSATLPERGDDEFVALRLEPGAKPHVVLYGRLLAAHMNNDGNSAVALWSAAIDDDALIGDTIGLAIARAGHALRRERAS